MSNKKEEIIQAEETTEMEVVVEESKFKKTLIAVGKGIKKHKKKIVAGAAIIGGAILVAVLRGRKSDDCDLDYETDIDEDLIEFEEISEETVEVE